MKSKSKRPTLEAVRIGLAQVFRRNGYEGASLDQLSAATGLGRSSLYHHFPAGKQAMGQTAVAQVRTQFDQQILQPLQSAGDPLSQLQQMVQTLENYYEQGNLACILIAFSVGGSRHQFTAELQQVYVEWLTAIAAVLQDAGYESSVAIERSQEAIIQIEGALVLSLATEQKELFHQTLKRIPERLLAKV